MKLHLLPRGKIMEPGKKDKGQEFHCRTDLIDDLGFWGFIFPSEDSLYRL